MCISVVSQLNDGLLSVSILNMKKISFTISKKGKRYTASAVGFFIVTQGKNLDELSKNIREATELYFENSKVKTKNNFNFISLDLPLYA